LTEKNAKRRGKQSRKSNLVDPIGVEPTTSRVSRKTRSGSDYVFRDSAIMKRKNNKKLCAFILPNPNLFSKQVVLTKRNARSACCPLCAPAGARSPRRKPVVILQPTLRKESFVVILATPPHHLALAPLVRPPDQMRAQVLLPYY